uniref:Uncharacterized protein n=1 Tax=Oryctolagus cuniculus TaxID=9986 RepID=G1SWR8_RABIT
MESNENVVMTFYNPEVPKVKGKRTYQKITSSFPGPPPSSPCSPPSLALAGSYTLASLEGEL